ncbi:MAG: hypothetical protein PHQ32_08105 [Firmicutes bacterium]|nr:hypothetical protein [Bacillota bacterium]
MEKDVASLTLGIVAIFFIFLFGQSAVLSLACAGISIAFGILSMKSGGRRKYYLSGIGASMMAIFLYAFPKFF